MSTRRTFLKQTAATPLIVDPFLTWITNFLKFEDKIGFKCTILRPSDLLQMHFYFIDFEYEDNLIFRDQIKGNKNSRVVVRLPQQHVSEKGFPKSLGIPLDLQNNERAKSYISGFSYLVLKFKEDDDDFDIRLKSSDLMNFSRFKLVLSDSLNPETLLPPVGNLKSTKTLITLFEFPFRANLIPMSMQGLENVVRKEFDKGYLKDENEKNERLEIIKKEYINPYLSNQTNRTFSLFSNNLSIDNSNTSSKFKVDIFELWNTNLIGSKTTIENYLGGPKFIVQSKSTKDFKGVLPSSKQLNALSKLTSDLGNLDRYVESKYFNVSPYGITTDLLYGNNEVPSGITTRLTDWQQITALGRDNLIVVSTIYIDTEFGLQFKFTQINKRIFKQGVSYIEERYYIEKLDLSLELNFSGNRGREFKTIKPNFNDKIYINPVLISSDGKINCIKPKEEPFTALVEDETCTLENLQKFPFIGIDHDNREIELEAPLIFIPSEEDKKRSQKYITKANKFKVANRLYYHILHKALKINFTQPYLENVKDRNARVRVDKDGNEIKTKLRNGLFTTYKTFSLAIFNEEYSAAKPLYSRLFYANVKVDAMKGILTLRENLTFSDVYFNKKEKNANEYRIFATFLKNELDYTKLNYNSLDPIKGNQKVISGVFDKGVGESTYIIKPDRKITNISEKSIGTSVNDKLNRSRGKIKKPSIASHPPGDILTGKTPNILGDLNLKKILSHLEIGDFPVDKIVDSTEAIIDSIKDIKSAVGNILDQLKGLNLTDVESLKNRWKTISENAQRIKDEIGEIKDELEIFKEFYHAIKQETRNKLHKEREGYKRHLYIIERGNFSSYYNSKYSGKVLKDDEYTEPKVKDYIVEPSSDYYDVMLGGIYLRRFMESIAPTLNDAINKDDLERQIIIKGTIYKHLLNEDYPLDKSYFKRMDAVFVYTKDLWSKNAELSQALELTSDVYAKLKLLFYPAIDYELGYVDMQLSAFISFDLLIELIYEESIELQEIQTSASKLKDIYDSILKKKRDNLKGGLKALNPQISDADIDKVLPIYNSDNFLSRNEFEKTYKHFKDYYNELVILKLGSKKELDNYRKRIEQSKEAGTISEVSDDISKFFKDLTESFNKWFKELQSKFNSNETIKDVKKKIKKLKELYALLQKLTHPKIEREFKTKKLKTFNSFVIGYSPLPGAHILSKTSFSYPLHKLDFDRPPRLADVNIKSYNEITNSSFTFLKSIVIVIDKISITGGTNIKEKVDFKILDVGFLGPLKFLSAIQKYFETLTTVLDFDVNARGIKMSYLLPLPTINGGVILFNDLKFNVGLSIPFRANTPINIILGINSKAAPFSVIAYGFPGNGYFFIGIDPKQGIVHIEIMVEFGKTAEFNFGIAEGQLSLKAGIYFRKYYDDLLIKAYVIAFGKIKILKAFSFSIYFHLILKYHNGLLDGQAILVFKKKIGFIKLKFKVKVYMKFKAPKEAKKEPTLKQDEQYALAGPGSDDENRQKNSTRNAFKDNSIFPEALESVNLLEDADTGAYALRDFLDPNLQKDEVEKLVEDAEKRETENELELSESLEEEKNSDYRYKMNYSLSDYYKSYYHK